MKRRLEIARGLMHSPRVLFLDEPTIGLDPESRSTLWTYVDELRRRERITIFLTTHYMDEAERCDRIAIVDRGPHRGPRRPGRPQGAVGEDRVVVTTADDAAAAAPSGTGSMRRRRATNRASPCWRPTAPSSYPGCSSWASTFTR